MVIDKVLLFKHYYSASSILTVALMLNHNKQKSVPNEIKINQDIYNAG